MRCGLDLDGVAYPFVDEYRSWAAELGVIARDCRFRYPDDSWDFPSRWGLASDVYLDVLVAGVVEGRIFADADPLPGAVDAAWGLVADGHDLVVVTARCFPGLDAADVEAITAGWLARVGFPRFELHVCADKTTVELDTMLDDSVDNHRMLRASGVASFLLECPWNMDTVVPAAERVGRVGAYPGVVRSVTAVVASGRHVT